MTSIHAQRLPTRYPYLTYASLTCNQATRVLLLDYLAYIRVLVASSTMISSPRTGVAAALLLVTSALSHFSSPMLVDASSISSAATDFDDGVKVTYSAGGARIVERRLQSKYDELCSDCKLFTVTPTLEFILRAFKFVTDMEECLHVTIW